MVESGEFPVVSEDEVKITLGLLNAVGENSSVTQRTIASELGIALGMTNAYLKRCVRKGLIKVQQVPANRYAYYLTPKGFAEKTRLTGEYLTVSFNFFRDARNQCAELFDHCAAQGWNHIALAGVSDLCEIATLCAIDLPIELVGTIDPAASETGIAGLRVVSKAEELGSFDAILITDLTNPQATFNRLREGFAPNRLLAPAFLQISLQPPVLAEDTETGEDEG